MKILKKINGESLLKIHLKSLSKSKYYENLVGHYYGKDINLIIDSLKKDVCKILSR